MTATDLVPLTAAFRERLGVDRTTAAAQVVYTIALHPVAMSAEAEQLNPLGTGVLGGPAYVLGRHFRRRGDLRRKHGQRRPKWPARRAHGNRAAGHCRPLRGALPRAQPIVRSLGIRAMRLKKRLARHVQ